MQLCYNTVTHQERKQGWRYEYLMRVRPDAEFPTRLTYNLDNVDKTAVTVFSLPAGWTSVPDHFAIVPRQFADVYFNTADTYFDCVPQSITVPEREKWCIHANVDIDPDFAPECYLSRWLKGHNVKLRFFNYPVTTIVRGDKNRSPHWFPDT